ncbi:hypothetical protein [Aeromonas caviae]|uniref:Uncharacterized protein n=1 Tax=Aeromonas caviae TaxID=648 RepID=A0AAV4YLD2_AERCA|nr:hypothetical protein [Aeromonas caviae]BDN91186.1 hypothetical protein KAM497c_07300 [Aeromonas caviae]GJA32962.1 hypothetical protein KAM341_26400 [Aeromonas caviae]GJA37378.1 hypothetical protein KAM342_26210 [Aeromonas caviae]GJA41963.1 hypothetical protein KAM343_27590 [Aeromonas caviae]GJA77648.1 hypothetical protein KAM354_28840 [Aeromonas caviae]
MNIQKLESKIKETEQLIEHKRSQSNLESFALSLSLKSLESHLEDLHLQLRRAKQKREKEVIELRLIGGEVNNGTVPLDILANIAKSFSGLISSASAKIKIGKDISGVIPFEVTQPLNLRFADIGHGSSRLFVTGDSSPDIFGESLLEHSLQGLFELLNKDLNEGISDQVHYMGLRSTHNLAEFLKVLRKRSIELELSWTAPNEKKHFWYGRWDKIQTLEKLLDGFSVSEPADITVEGIIELISKSGKVDVRKNDDELIKVTYSQRLYSEVRKLRLGDIVRLDCKETTVFNASTQESKNKYSLVKILWEQ